MTGGTHEIEANTEGAGRAEFALLCGGMEFDLFKAMAHMENAFGDCGEILIRKNDVGYIVRLSKYCDKNCIFHHREFMASFKEINQGVANVMGMKFYKALEQLKRQAT